MEGSTFFLLTVWWQQCAHHPPIGLPEDSIIFSEPCSVVCAEVLWLLCQDPPRCECADGTQRAHLGDQRGWACWGVSVGGGQDWVISADPEVGFLYLTATTRLPSETGAVTSWTFKGGGSPFDSWAAGYRSWGNLPPPPCLREQTLRSSENVSLIAITIFKGSRELKVAPDYWVMVSLAPQIDCVGISNGELIEFL